MSLKCEWCIKGISTEKDIRIPSASYQVFTHKVPRNSLGLQVADVSRHADEYLPEMQYQTYDAIRCQFRQEIK